MATRKNGKKNGPNNGARGKKNRMRNTKEKNNDKVKKERTRATRREREERDDMSEEEREERFLRRETTNSIWAIAFFGVAILLILAGFAKAGPAGSALYYGLDTLLGWGYFILPSALIFNAIVLIVAGRRRILGMTTFGAGLLILSFLGIIEVLSPGNGGWLGMVLGSLKIPFGPIAALIINLFVLAISILITANLPLKLEFPHRRTYDEDGETAEDGTYEAEDESPLVVTGTGDEDELIEEEGENNEHTERGNRKKGKGSKDDSTKEKERGEGDEAPSVVHAKNGEELGGKTKKGTKVPVFANYVPPPLSLLKSDSNKPTTGDLLANANVIKRTLESFGVAVEMGEINVGPSVTRYTLKPAEGVKLSRITALNPDLALALAAHPVRIEAPIPGKSLVGIEVPNKAAALVRLGSLMHYPEFHSSGPLSFALGRDVSGEPIFANIEKMPHMLVAGATGSGKSILVHGLITSLLYKNSPKTLKLALIDPKRVELSMYDGIPHLITPVITENKKALGVLRWAISEMDRRYELLQRAGSRDIKSYNASHKGDEALPYVLIGIDEMADLMGSFGRDVEGAIVRLAQMARATGIHLLLATQRPSVEVITGLIKANIPARVALQVASQIDSRTILDTAGAEKLLGHGDLLFLSADLSKPKRIQGSYITEEELKSVVSFIKENNKPQTEESDEDSENENGKDGADVDGEQEHIDKGGPIKPQNIDAFLNGGGASGNDGEGEEDELFDEALATVAEAQKASASLLQRRLKVGYARAARLLDLMESAGYIGPGAGAKPRDVDIEKIEERLS